MQKTSGNFVYRSFCCDLIWCLRSSAARRVAHVMFAYLARTMKSVVLFLYSCFIFNFCISVIFHSFVSLLRMFLIISMPLYWHVWPQWSAWAVCYRLSLHKEFLLVCTSFYMAVHKQWSIRALCGSRNRTVLELISLDYCSEMCAVSNAVFSATTL